MSNEGLLTNREDEPIKESEITCDYCAGPASWDVVTYEDEATGKVTYACHKHHTRMLEKNEVFVERRIGEETWEEIEAYRMLLNKWDTEKHA